MRYQRLPDCRPPRFDDSLTSASSHPELTFGEFAMRPRMRVFLTPAERKSHANWSVGVLMIVFLVVLATMTLPAFQSPAPRPLSVVATQDR